MVTVPVPTYIDERGFDDHSVPRVDTTAELLALARGGVGGQSAIKFTIPAFDQPPDAPGLPRAHIMDSRFFGLHDEWFYFRLLNGQPVAGSGQTPVAQLQFRNVEQIYAWARAQPKGSLPLGLTWAGDRLYSPRFYDLSLNTNPRTLGVGSIVHFDAADATNTTGNGTDAWLLELEYSD
ncbi:MAG TPA: hypothetical protein PLV68_01690, partial [Ilumatobacteraceae bacterium]|nr:hypothetical protein [Ilumatobacteraceae bacterium]